MHTELLAGCFGHAYNAELSPRANTPTKLTDDSSLQFFHSRPKLPGATHPGQARGCSSAQAMRQSYMAGPTCSCNLLAGSLMSGYSNTNHRPTHHIIRALVTELTCLGRLWPCLDPPEGRHVPHVPRLQLLHLALNLPQVRRILLGSLHAGAASSCVSGSCQSEAPVGTCPCQCGLTRVTLHDQCCAHALSACCR